MAAEETEALSSKYCVVDIKKYKPCFEEIRK